ncbi:pyrimidine-nucleoside phosphorylase [Crossiella equi]|uniref:Pyrimidine-nucleoside phosphorylase n=1 Tax=Crossiella equi TaxID=130796 RepID=A0ABS5A5C8_9PSEU|nr:thymidine phosphorylase [Crossiella equi]MBP2471444.1 pyrimidine-nucleoside phosphorylase [Crossiella equi]
MTAVEVGGRTRAAGAVLAAIAAKRDGAELTAEQITSVVADYTAGHVPDYQMSAWLMAVACRGMTMAETVALTRAYVDSGEVVDLSAATRPVVDKHSSGGVGDKVSLFVAPVVAALGVDVLKMSGRGLDFAGGTLDKLESIPGMRVDLAEREMHEVLARTGMVITGQTARLVPADGATYALRDVTGSVHSLPLIAASIMSKKIAGGARGVVLDVKTGPGGLVGDLASARELARTMVEIGAAFGLRATAVLSDMSQPLGRAVGNALEVAEAVAALRGAEVPGFTDLAVHIAACMLRLADPALSEPQALHKVRGAVADGSAHGVFRAWLAAQGGDPRVADDPDLLPAAPHRTTVTAAEGGWVTDVDARALGRLSLTLGAGRLVHGQDIDHAVGLVVHRRVGDRVERGEPLVEIHARQPDPATGEAARAAFTLTERPCPARPVVLEVLGG